MKTEDYVMITVMCVVMGPLFLAIALMFIALGLAGIRTGLMMIWSALTGKSLNL